MGEPSAILVVEDDELVQDFLCRALSGIASVIDSCGDGASALHAVAARSYGLILLDGLLPDTHGLDLGKKLLVHPATRGSALCLVSGSLRFARPASDGIAALPKPLRVRELVATAEALLNWSSTASVDEASRSATLALLAADLLVR